MSPSIKVEIPQARIDAEAAKALKAANAKVARLERRVRDLERERDKNRRLVDAARQLKEFIKEHWGDCVYWDEDL